MITEESERVAWSWLIDQGDIVKGWSFYGGFFEKDEYKNKKYSASAITLIGIDWGKTDPIHEDREAVFAGTFAEHNEYRAIVEGTLVLKNGIQLNFGFDGEININEIINFILNKDSKIYV